MGDMEHLIPSCRSISYKKVKGDMGYMDAVNAIMYN